MIGLGLNGCANISKTGIASSVVASGTTALLGVNAVGIASVGAMGLAADYLVNEDNEISVSTLEALPIEERGAYLKSMAFWNALKDLGYFGIGAIFLFFLIPYLIGYFIPTKRRRRLERAVFDHPEIKSEDLK